MRTTHRLTVTAGVMISSLMLIGMMCSACSKTEEKPALCPVLPNGNPIATGEAGMPDPIEQTQAATPEQIEKIKSLANGVYEGKATGMSGQIWVQLRVEDGTLSVLRIWQDGETQGVGGYEAIKNGTFAKMINKAQGPDIDAVSGATMTTLAIQEAVTNALSKEAVHE